MYHRIVEVDSPGTKLRIEAGSLKIETAVSLRESFMDGVVKIHFPELVRDVGDDNVRLAG